MNIPHTLTRDTRRWLDCVTNPDHVSPAQRPQGRERVALIPTIRTFRLRVPTATATGDGSQGYFATIGSGLFRPGALLTDTYKYATATDVRGAPAWVLPDDPVHAAMFATGTASVRTVGTAGTNGEQNFINPFHTQVDGQIADLTMVGPGAIWDSNSGGTAASAENVAYPFWQPGLEDLSQCRVRINGSYIRVEVVAPQLNTAWDGIAAYFPDAALAQVDNLSDLEIRAMASERFNHESEKFGTGVKIRTAGLYSQFREPDVIPYERAGGVCFPPGISTVQDYATTSATPGEYGNPYTIVNPDLEDLDERCIVVVRNTGATDLTLIVTIVCNIECTGSGAITQFSPCYPRIPPLVPDVFLPVAQHMSLMGHPLIVGPNSFRSFMEKHALPFLKAVVGPLAGAILGPEAAIAAPMLVGAIDTAVKSSKHKKSEETKPPPKPPKKAPVRATPKKSPNSASRK